MTLDIIQMRQGSSIDCHYLSPSHSACSCFPLFLSPFSWYTWYITFRLSLQSRVSMCSARTAMMSEMKTLGLFAFLHCHKTPLIDHVTLTHWLFLLQLWHTGENGTGFGVAVDFLKVEKTCSLGMKWIYSLETGLHINCSSFCPPAWLAWLRPL